MAYGLSESRRGDRRGIHIRKECSHCAEERCKDKGRVRCRDRVRAERAKVKRRVRPAGAENLRGAWSCRLGKFNTNLPKNTRNSMWRIKVNVR
jgi:hypothetical protein